MPIKDLKIRGRRMSTTAIMTEGGLGRGCSRKARKILKRPSESKARAALFTYFRFLSQNTSVMASFREIRSILLQSFDDGYILEDEFLILYDVNTSKNPDFPNENYGKFDLNDVDDSACLSEFRFRKGDLSAFWTAPPSYFQPLVAASVAAFLPFSISA